MQQYFYRYHVAACPGCGFQFSQKGSLRLRFAEEGLESPDGLHLSPTGWLTLDGHPFKSSKELAAECVFCEADLWDYVSRHEAKGDKADKIVIGTRPDLLPLPWSREGLNRLADFPPGDMPEAVRHICLSIIDEHHAALARGENIGMGAKAHQKSQQVADLMMGWAKTIDEALRLWREGRPELFKKKLVR
jgi:hypothetical protein